MVPLSLRDIAVWRAATYWKLLLSSRSTRMCSMWGPSIWNVTRPHDFSLPMTKGQDGANIGRSLIHDVFGCFWCSSHGGGRRVFRGKIAQWGSFLLPDSMLSGWCNVQNWIHAITPAACLDGAIRFPRNDDIRKTLLWFAHVHCAAGWSVAWLIGWYWVDIIALRCRNMDKTMSFGSNLTQSESGTLVLLVAQLNLHTTHMLISIGPKYIMSHPFSIVLDLQSITMDTCLPWPPSQTSPTTFCFTKNPRRVHQESLDTLTLGWQITELRRLAACNTYLGGWNVGEDGGSKVVCFHVLHWYSDEQSLLFNGAISRPFWHFRIFREDGCCPTTFWWQYLVSSAFTAQVKEEYVDSFKPMSLTSLQRTREFKTTQTNIWGNADLVVEYTWVALTMLNYDSQNLRCFNWDFRSEERLKGTTRNCFIWDFRRGRHCIYRSSKGLRFGAQVPGSYQRFLPQYWHSEISNSFNAYLNVFDSYNNVQLSREYSIL